MLLKSFHVCKQPMYGSNQTTEYLNLSSLVQTVSNFISRAPLKKAVCKNNNMFRSNTVIDIQYDINSLKHIE